MRSEKKFFCFLQHKGGDEINPPELMLMFSCRQDISLFQLSHHPVAITIWEVHKAICTV